MMKVEGNTVCRVQSEAKKQRDHTINLTALCFCFISIFLGICFGNKKVKTSTACWTCVLL